MRWVDWMPVLTGVLYLIAAGGYAAEGQRGLGFAYFGYAVANVGLIWAATEGR